MRALEVFAEQLVPPGAGPGRVRAAARPLAARRRLSLWLTGRGGR